MPADSLGGVLIAALDSGCEISVTSVEVSMDIDRWASRWGRGLAWTETMARLYPGVRCTASIAHYRLSCTLIDGRMRRTLEEKWHEHSASDG